MYHIFALTVNVVTCMLGGFRTILIVNPRDLPTVIGPYKKYQPSFMTGVNTLFKGLLNQKSFRELDHSKLEIVIGGGMAV